MSEPAQNPHAGLPFDDDDATIAAALEDVSIPALLCSLVHITGDPSWIRGDLRPQGSMLNEYQGYMPEEMKAEARRRALPAIAAYRDGGCVLPRAAVARAAARDDGVPRVRAGPRADVAPMFLEDLHLDGSDAGAITWGDEIPDDVRGRRPRRRRSVAARPGCSPASASAQAGIPYTIVEKNAGPGGTWWDNRYPGARVDIGSHFYCYSFEPGRPLDRVLLAAAGAARSTSTA